jgi:hypothetical protein
MFFCFTAAAQAELMLYIKETNLTTNVVRELSVTDGDTLFETQYGQETVDFIELDIGALETHFFQRWTFGGFFQATTSLGTNIISGLPSQLLNLEFNALSSASNTDNYSLEVIMTYLGNNGVPGKSSVEFFGGGNSTTPGFEFVASYSSDQNDVFYTNDFLDKDGPQYVKTESPPLNINNDFSSLESTKDIQSSNLYALTYGVRLLSVAPGGNFYTQGGAEYMLPEPASMASWALLGLTFYRSQRRKKLSKSRLAI